MPGGAGFGLIFSNPPEGGGMVRIVQPFLFMDGAAQREESE